MRTKKDWISFRTLSPLSVTGDSRLILLDISVWTTGGGFLWDEPSIIRCVGSVTAWSEDDDVTDAAVLYRVGFQFSRAARSANPRMLSDGFDSDLRWMAGGVLINSGAAADQIHAFGRVGYHQFDFRPNVRVVDDQMEVSLNAEIDQQSGTISPVLFSAEGRFLISAGY